MKSETINLYKTNKNSIFRIVSVPRIELLESLGLRVGTLVEVQNRYALGGPVLLRVEERYSVAVGKDIAAQIAVTEVESA
ncbi:MAG: ferrous iron transport protein A [Oscillospiraceae bacterium]|nr:ferrous iron transport protein A [Oscillospiraceae bacterium]